jgi:hypothetical protein
MNFGPYLAQNAARPVDREKSFACGGNARSAAPRVGAFSRQVDTGWREENASKETNRAPVLIQSEPGL